MLSSVEQERLIAVICQTMETYRPLIEKTLAKLDHTHDYDALLKLVMRGEAQFWPLPSSFLITEITQYPRKKILRVAIAGGNMQELLNLHDKVVRLARKQKCDEIEIRGRRGWLRVFGKPWREKETVMARPVEGTRWAA